MSKIFSIYQNNLIIYGSKTEPKQEAILSLIKNQLGVKKIIEDSSTPKVYLNKNGELVVKSIEYRLDTDLGTPLYKFGLLSDTHTDGDGDDYGNSISDLNNAIAFFNNENCDFICYCGDMGYDGRDEDYTVLKSCLDKSAIPNYTIRGNHDAKSLTNGYLTATGMTEEDYTIEKGNDLFIFLSLDNDNSRGTTGGLTQEKVDWLTNIINNSRHQRIFLFYHFFFKNASGDGANVYQYDTIGDGVLVDYAQDFVNLVKNTPNLIFCHGHSHMKFSLEDKYTNANHYHEEGKWYDIHVPSCARPRDADMVSIAEGSEGYLVEVYQDKVLFKPRDFIANEYLMQYVYIIEL